MTGSNSDSPLFGGIGIPPSRISKPLVEIESIAFNPYFKLLLSDKKFTPFVLKPDRLLLFGFSPKK